MKNTLKNNIYIVGENKFDISFIDNSLITNNIEEADIILFTGGEDVDPSFYGCKKHHTTYSDPSRDEYELNIYKKSFSYNNVKLRLGICRGSQFLVMANGGLLVQNVKNHGLYDTHEIINKDGELYEITSTHHQMHYPYNMPQDRYEILYWASPKRSNIYEGHNIEQDWSNKVEPEITYFKDTKSLCIQGHPEYMNSNHETNRMINELIKSLI